MNATPEPLSPGSGYVESARCGFTSATTAGSTGGRWWWSVTMTSMPRSAAAATSATLVDPVSTVTISVTPWATAASTAAIDSPWPSSSRDGTYGTVAIPSRRKAITSCARPVSPSASKSPNTMTRSSPARAWATRATSSPASGRSRGSWSPSAAGPRNAASARSSEIPRRAITVAAKVPTPWRFAASRSTGSSRSGSGKTQR